MLVGGLVSAAALVAAGLLARADPELVGAGAAARAAGEVADGIRAEWARLVRDAAWFEPEPAELDAAPGATPDAASDRFAWREGEPLGADRAAAEPVDLASLRDPDARRNQGFDLLFGELRRLEVAGRHAAARAAALDAREADHGPAREIELRLAELRLAAHLGDGEGAWAAWLALDRATPDGRIARGETSVLLIGAVTALGALDAQRAAAVRARVDALWAADALALPGRAPRDAPDLLSGGDPTRAALLRELHPDGAAPDAVRAAEERRRARALLALIDERPSAPVSVVGGHAEPTTIVDLGEHVVVRRRSAGSGSRAGPRAGFEARVLPRAWLAARLREATSAQLPAGFHVVFDREPARPGELVRARTALAGDAFGFEVRHDDPPALARGEAARLAGVQGGLLVLAALVAGLSVFTWRALQRERRLADLRAGFVASVSHELRTPLASILLMAENLEQGRVPEASRPRYHELIRREARRLARLVDDVLDVSRLERGEPPPLCAEDLDVAGWLASLEAEARERVEQGGGTLAFRAERAPATLHADGEALRRAALNLVDNAMKHSGSGEIDLSIESDRGALVLTVRDRGRGVPPERREEIFAPFARLNGERVVGGQVAPGAGLGLAIVREIARAHGGTAVARAPEDGPGAAFELRLPLEGPPASPASPDARGPEEAR